ncbi:hypothetical protein COY52_10365 [Candidatus Desantisbacteria bacterium CG_4_10_14_0_8_um_filter_48_22]|uniref:Uncharacterized protein n=1 Tax=Candidatus Desantisbacteria bacterium CG_4_10_14_0_8_um_filter_48_22 TaxID=1974543 RepID=A0A2M7S6H8_9BACT|nr:MAG: hypothetical protein COS16_01690 [Candidatus Desantisbacteria bacterium CG02_land_8_20_14_3_00_49_13]PIZ15127.1 MAG: hypothetical protein COY52_10365 [Candidatus Desantisbacteria bacterium CG_4_10_14_0_8_um_filter_48_22]
MSKTIELEIPSELRYIVKLHPEIDWTGIARKAMWEYGRKLESLNKILSRSKLAEGDILTIGETIKSGLLKKYKQR